MMRRKSCMQSDNLWFVCCLYTVFKLMTFQCTIDFHSKSSFWVNGEHFHPIFSWTWGSGHSFIFPLWLRIIKRILDSMMSFINVIIFLKESYKHICYVFQLYMKVLLFRISSIILLFAIYGELGWLLTLSPPWLMCHLYMKKNFHLNWLVQKLVISYIPLENLVYYRVNYLL